MFELSIDVQESCRHIPMEWMGISSTQLSELRLYQFYEHIAVPAIQVHSYLYQLSSYSRQVFLPFALLLWINIRIIYEIKHSYSAAQIRKKSLGSLNQHVINGSVCELPDNQGDHQVVVSMPLGLIGYVFETRGG